MARGFIILTGILALAGAAAASESTTYIYDSHGRLVTVTRSGAVNSGVTTTYSYDGGDNRTVKTTTGAAFSAAAPAEHAAAERATTQDRSRPAQPAEPQETTAEP